MRSQVRLRAECPACLGVVLDRVSAAPGVDIDHCRRCGGTWILRRQTAQLRAVPAAALRATITREQDAAFLCHGCHTPMERDAAACASCGWKNALECPECGRAMRRETRQDVAVDVCKPCQAVWLDHHELASLWAVAAAGAVAHSSMAGNLANDVNAGSFLLDVLWYAPDLAVGAVHLTGHVIGAGVEAAAHLPGALASTPEAVAVAAEVAGEAAGGVFSFIAEIIGGIFEAF